MPSSPDLALCEREPITTLERIQPFGFLLALSKDWIIARASANLIDFLGVDAVVVIGRKIDELIDRNTLHEIRNRTAFLSIRKGVERIYGLTLVQGHPAVDVAIHYCGALFVLEGELHRTDVNADTGALVRSMMTRLASKTSPDAYHQDAVRQLRALTGFGRVMIYRFDPSGAGEVIAESVAAGMSSYLGLHYPASDIPMQARALYLRNAFRIIADVAADDVRLLPASGEAVQPLDLSLAVTRAVSPVHIEYLRNMGVAASLSISIVVNGALWGLIACHNAVPLLPSFAVRTAAELFGQVYSLTLESALHKAQREADAGARSLVDRLSMAVAGNGALISRPAWLREMLRGLLECDGFGTWVEGKLSISGSTPSPQDIALLIERLNGAQPNTVFATDHLAGFLDAVSFAPEVAAGMLAIPISRVPRDYLLLFRREHPYAQQWAGRPDKVVTESEDGLRLSPRKSFEAFTQLVRGRSLPFSSDDRRAAEAIRVALVEVILQITTASEDERRKSVERQELLIAELNHRVRNILALVRALVSQTDSGDMNVAPYVKSLNGRIQAVARAHDQITRQNWGPGGIASLIEGELNAYLPDFKEHFALLGADVLLHPLGFSTLALVVHELVTNSAKYGALSDSGRVSVILEREPGAGLHLQWREQGGPPVQIPTRRGFGSVIIERVVPFDLHGSAEVRYLPAGLEADFFIPEIHIAAVPDAPPADGEDPTRELPVIALPLADLPLRDRTVLLLEDNLIIALETEDLLTSLGAKRVSTASSIEEAARLLAAQKPDFAVLDINVGRQSSLAFADVVGAAGVPYIFASGYGDSLHLGELQTAAVVCKPYTREDLGRVISLQLAD